MYIHGTISGSDGKYRVNTKTKELEFILWETGEQGHTSPYWHRTGSGWINSFTPGYPTEIQKADRLEF